MEHNNVGLAMEDNDLPKFIEQAYANAGFACGEGDFELRAYRSFCQDMKHIEALLREKGLLPKPRVPE